MWRERNPVRAAYLNLKSNAKRRGKQFELTFEEFEEFAVSTSYIAKKGRRKHSMHIDRIDENIGYTRSNIQPLQNGQNVRKYLRYRYDEYERKMKFDFKTLKFNTNDNSEYPF